MKVLRLHGAHDLRLGSEEEPKPAPDEALLQVTAVGLCGSDLHWFDHAAIGDAEIFSPLILGHEFAGRVEGGALHGARMAVDPAVPCMACDLCLQGHPNLCREIGFAGHGEVDGALREKMTWPRRLLHVLPEAISDLEGAMLEPLGVAIHAVDLSHLKPGMRVGVYGCGPIGLLTIQLLKAMGAAQILATERLDHRLEAALRFGATEVFEVVEGQEREAIWSATDGQGVDVAFEAAGENDAVETAIETAKPGGCVVLVGIPGTDRTGFRASTARRKGLTIKLCRRMKHTYPRAIRLVEQGVIDVASLVTHEFPLEAFEQAFDTAVRREGLKVVIRPSGMES